MAEEEGIIRFPNFETFDEFIDQLRRQDYKVGLDEYIAVHKLLLTVFDHGQWPDDLKDLAPWLAPLLCSSPEEQEGFYTAFSKWVDGLSLHADEPAKPQPATEPETKAANNDPQPRLSTVWKLAIGIGAGFVLAASLLALLKPGIYQRPANSNQSNNQSNANSATLVTNNTNNNGETRVTSIPVSENRSIALNNNSSTPDPQTTPVHLTPEADLKLQQPQKATVSVRRKYTTMATIAFPLLLLGGFLLWEKIRRMQLRRKYMKRTPLSENLKVKGVAEKFFNGQLLRTTSQQLRRHRPGSLRDITVEATIQETARKGGLLTLIYAPRKSLPEYLVLIDRCSQSDHQARLQEELINRLIENDVILATYYFSGDPRICRVAPGSQPLKLQTLEALHPNHSALIFSDGARLISPLTERPHRWLDIFSAWPERALFTHLPPDEWGQGERALSEAGFAVLPATEYGLEAFVKILQTGKAPNIKGYGSPLLYPETLGSDPERWVENDPPDADDIEILCVELQYYLGLEGYYWLAACAIYPRVQWEITVYLGQIMTDGQEFEQRLSSLARLPWFRHSTMPEWLRAALVNTLPKEQEQKIRETLESLLLTSLERPEGFDLELASEPSEQSSPRSDSLFDRAVKFIKSINDKLRLRAVLRIEQEEGELRDYVFLSFLSGQKVDRLAVSFPKKLLRLLFRGRHSIQGLRPAVLFLFAILLSLSGWWLARPRQDESQKIAKTPSFKVAPSIGMRGEQPTVAVSLADSSDIERTVDAEFPEIAPLRQEIDKLEASIRLKENECNYLLEQYTAEAEGTGGSGRSGLGPVYYRKRLEHDQCIAELNTFKAITQAEIAQKYESLTPLIERRNSRLDNLKKDFDCGIYSLKDAVIIAPAESGLSVGLSTSEDCNLSAQLTIDGQAPVGYSELQIKKGDSVIGSFNFLVTDNKLPDLNPSPNFGAQGKTVNFTVSYTPHTDCTKNSLKAATLTAPPGSGINIQSIQNSDCELKAALIIDRSAPVRQVDLKLESGAQSALIPFTIRSSAQQGDPGNQGGPGNQGCPTLTVDCPNDLQPGRPFTLTATIQGGRITQPPKYHWLVSYYSGPRDPSPPFISWVNQTTDVPSVTATYPATSITSRIRIALKVDGYNCPLSVQSQICSKETNPQKAGRLRVQFRNVDKLRIEPTFNIFLALASSPGGFFSPAGRTFSNVNLFTQRELMIDNLPYGSYSLSLEIKGVAGSVFTSYINFDKDGMTHVIDLAEPGRIYPVRLEVTYKEVAGLNRFVDRNRGATIDAKNIINAIYLEPQSSQISPRQQPPRYAVTVRAFSVATNEELKGVNLYYVIESGNSLRPVKMASTSPATMTLDAGSYSFFAAGATTNPISPISANTRITLGK